MRSPAPFPESHLRVAVAEGSCWADCLRGLGYETKGHNFRTVQKWVRYWDIPTDHFDPNVARARSNSSRARPLEEVMVVNSDYERGKLKRRLLAAGLKQNVCEICSQGDRWRGQPMSMVLDHINGVPNDHRLENLRMLCPNCAATLDTHCGRNTPRERTCPSCHTSFVPRDNLHHYCSTDCWGSGASERYIGVPRPESRKVERPPRDELLRELAASNFSAVGRKYGVTDNAIRKWVRWYEREEVRTDADAAVADDQAVQSPPGSLAA